MMFEISIIPTAQQRVRHTRSGAAYKSREQEGKIGHTVKPDVDNLAKQLLDAMTRLRFWDDDRQIVELTCRKRYEEEPRWEICVQQVPEMMI